MTIDKRLYSFAKSRVIQNAKGAQDLHFCNHMVRVRLYTKFEALLFKVKGKKLQLNYCVYKYNEERIFLLCAENFKLV